MKRCGACRRHLLAGEIAVQYRGRFGKPTDVCVLCRDAASARGWKRSSAPSERQLVAHVAVVNDRRCIGAHIADASGYRLRGGRFDVGDAFEV